MKESSEVRARNSAAARKTRSPRSSLGTITEMPMTRRPFLLSSLAATLLPTRSLWSPSLGGPSESGRAATAPGSLMLVGGGQIPDPVRAQFVALAGGRKARLVLLPTASDRADGEAPVHSHRIWLAHHVESVATLHTRNRVRANSAAFLGVLRSATAVWIGGGDQSLLAEAYNGTAVLDELRALRARGGVVGGTSAGAAIASAVMIADGTTTAELEPGFGLVPDLIVDQHFSSRERLPRLLDALRRHPNLIGLGIDEGTAALLTGTSLHVFGAAHVWLCVPANRTTPLRVQRLDSGQTLDLKGILARP